MDLLTLALIGLVGGLVDADGDVVAEREVEVTGAPTLYPLLEADELVTGTLEVEVPAGMAAYSFTFG